MKTRYLFVATLIGLGALGAPAWAAAQSASGPEGPAVSRQMEGSSGHARRGGKGHHRGHRFKRAGHGMGIARMDTDGDGRISRAELEAAASNRGGRGHRRGGGWLAGQFDAIDANGDGYIVRSELRAWREAQRAERRASREQRFQERFAAADLDGDGRLSRSEVEQEMPRLLPAFAWMDEDGDGFLDREELRPQGPR